jgi:hypothetical protein
MRLACWLSLGLNVVLGVLLAGLIWIVMTEPE